ncbi:recombinase family protein, partial [bacterium]|nr:recombinase family protein [bacterium]
MTGKKEVSAAGGPKKKLVAAYLRMSTGRQAGSIPNQRLALQSYAQRHRMEIVKEYVDSGKSGVTIKYRKGLQSLILDITGGKVDYVAVLVYDINRWGRFQDVDESAHYEFLCRNAGIEVIYCEEQFKNDGSIFTAVMKTIRRIKAAEDSRELSIKVIAGQSRLAKQGYKQGGPAGYGLRRVSVDRDGSIRRELANGERKSALTDRVLLILGPDHEVAVVR